MTRDLMRDDRCVTKQSKTARTLRRSSIVIMPAPTTVAASRSSSAPAPVFNDIAPHRRRRQTLRNVYRSALPSSGLVLDEFDARDVSAGVQRMRLANSSLDQHPHPDWLLAWFLRDRKLDADKAREKLDKYLAWRSADGGAYDVASLRRDPDVDAEASTGKAGLLDELDAFGRPVIYVTLTKHDAETRELARTCKLCVRLVDEALERMGCGYGDHNSITASSSSAETLLCVFDLRNFTMKNADIEFVKFFIKCIFDYFPKRISQVLLIEPPWVFTPVWQIVKPLMGKYASLVRQVKASDAAAYFNEDSTLFR